MPTGVILAGGRSSRMGRPKALVGLGGIPMIERVAARVLQVCDRLVVVANDPDHAAGLEATVVGDQTPHEGPLGGLLAGLAAAPSDPCVVVACDMPFLEPRLIEHLLVLADGVDAVVPRSEDGYEEPLHAVYRTSCLPAVRDALASGRRRANAFLTEVVTRWVEPAQCREHDPSGRSWWNVNTPEDLERAERLLA